ncbi:MAG TPA: methylmalonyl Co-A mutase-associated GTPase MeaB [Stellaceae bacterium]|nr:methylmalonyl Co-A mutase-associated GTPase MeaB [Stellaceae bacterium]
MGAAPIDVGKLAAGLRGGDRRALARAITLVESTREDHRAAAEALLALLLPESGKSMRLGISGAPGVGKSTFIEAFGLAVIAAGHRVAVLAVDPSSKRGGGSILGDKTRMAELARQDGAFIRPSPAGRTLGGVARRTREAIPVVEAAGFDVVIVETVGVGQSETAVADMVDLFLLLLAPGAGDDLQGIKRGIVELADLLIVNKADGDLEPAAMRAVADYRHAMRLLRPPADEAAAVVAISALERRGIDTLWHAVDRRIAALRASGGLQRRRAAQARAHLWSEVGEGLLELFRSDAKVAARLARLEAQVVSGAITPAAAAKAALQAFRRRPRSA